MLDGADDVEREVLRAGPSREPDHHHHAARRREIAQTLQGSRQVGKVVKGGNRCNDIEGLAKVIRHDVPADPADIAVLTSRSRQDSVVVVDVDSRYLRHDSTKISGEQSVSGAHIKC